MRGAPGPRPPRPTSHLRHPSNRRGDEPTATSATRTATPSRAWSPTWALDTSSSRFIAPGRTASRTLQPHLQTEWSYRQIFTSNTDRTQTPAPWLEHHNNHRRHTALGGHPPIVTNVMTEPSTARSCFLGAFRSPSAIDGPWPHARPGPETLGPGASVTVRSCQPGRPGPCGDASYALVPCPQECQ